MSDLRPRERMRAHGSEALSDAELVALLLRTGARGADALATATHLLDRWGGLRGLARAAAGELTLAAGLGPAKVASLLAACEVSRRLAVHRLQRGDPIRGPEDVHRHFHARLRDTLQECFIALLLDGRHRMLQEVAVSRGTLTASLVHPREVFRPAIREAAAALILVHNHPSGDPTPSREDLEVTHRLVQAGEVLGVRVLDHVVVAEAGYHSFTEDGQISRGWGNGTTGVPPRGPSRR